MNVLYYTVALGLGIKKTHSRVRRPTNELVLNEIHIPEPLTYYEVFAQRCRLPEFSCISDYDVICQIEADVDCAINPVYATDKIAVERGHKGSGPIPWNGVIWIPRVFYGFFNDWSKAYSNYKNFHYDEEALLLDALKSYPWCFIENSTVFPTVSELTHYRGRGKLALAKPTN